MEKFTVDLDKVLDDFEFNEEQAVRHTQYIREDLPAKKYQRPPFQRINLADADFSPSRQTSSPVISYISPQPIPAANVIPIPSASNVPSILCAKNGGETQRYGEINDDLVERVFQVAPEKDITISRTFPDLIGNEIHCNEPLVPLPDLTETGGDSGADQERVICDLVTDTNKGISSIEKLDKSLNIAEFNRTAEKDNESSLSDTVLNGKTKSEIIQEDEVTNSGQVYPNHLENKNQNKAAKELGVSQDREEMPFQGKTRALLSAGGVEGAFAFPRASVPSAEIKVLAGDEPIQSIEAKNIPYDEGKTKAADDVSIKPVKEPNSDSKSLVDNKIKSELFPSRDPAIQASYLEATHTITEKGEPKLSPIPDDLVRTSVTKSLETELISQTKAVTIVDDDPTNDAVLRAEYSNSIVDVKYINSYVPALEANGKTVDVPSSVTTGVSVPTIQANERVSESQCLPANEEKLTEKEVTEANSESSETFPVYSELEAVKPLAFDDSDIPDEDLEKFLEELEQEEEEASGCQELAVNCSDNEKEQESRGEEGNKEKELSKALSKETPQRPNYLELNNGEMRQSTSASGTPVLCESEPESEPNEDLDNELNEQGEAAVNDGNVSDSRPYQSTRVEAVNVPPGVAETPPPPTLEERRLGKVSPFWVPDADALNCMQCDLKFTVIKRRHHCRACGRVLCSKCCGMRASLEYLSNQEHRVCEHCFRTLTKVMLYEVTDSETETSPRRKPNPNNPMEYCSTVPPPLQACPSGSQPPPSVLVPVLKREGSTKNKETPKKVMFSDGIRPGGELTALDEPPLPRLQRASHGPKRVGTPPGSVVPSPVRILPPVDPTSQSFILEQCLPPMCEVGKGHIVYHDPWQRDKLMERLRASDQPAVLFAVNRHLIVSLKIVKKDCCMGQVCWAFSTCGMAAVGQDEMLVLLQMTGDENEPVPCEVFMQLHYIHQSAEKGNSIGELGYWSVKQSTFLDSRQHGGFLFVRPTFQCVQNLDRPPPPYLVAILIHRLELPWAQLFPLRLMLRLGAEFRYYPCSLVSVRHREPVYYEIGQTIMNLLADFRSYTFTLPAVKGLRIHMEAQQTAVLIPRNRYDEVVRALNNSNDPVLALAGTFSPDADAHLVCMQNKGDEITYSTQAINIHDKPRKVTGASFVVFNASLKAVGGVVGKSHIVEDGVMVEVSADTMATLRARLRALQDWSVLCGETHDELIQVTWCDDEKDFNRGVRSVIDGTPLDGVPSIRVHNSANYMCASRLIRWTEVFIIKCEDGATSAKIGDPLEVNRLSESIARATCTALTKAKLLDLLATAGSTILALRTTVTQDSVCYEAGSNGEKLPPIYMNSLDNELIPVLHKATANNSDACAILELVFHILDQ